MIYNGSDQRPSWNGFRVHHFNNEDNWLPIEYSEVVLTRRAYRDGTNEYLLNNQRSIEGFYELLAKTGLSERTYTIIGQGLVDLALSIRPDERRSCSKKPLVLGFIAHAKKRPQTLGSNAAQLRASSDILDEIKPRLRNLERQAVRARNTLLYKITYRTNYVFGMATIGIKPRRIRRR